MYGLSETDEKMLKMLMNMETKLVADRLNVDPPTIYKRLYRIRERRRKAQAFVNKLNNYDRRSPRLRKLLTPV